MIKIFLVVLCVFISHPALAASARVATSEDVSLLKQDLLSGKIQIGKTRLKNIRSAYGDPANITDTETKLTYDYGDLKIEFDKTRYFRKWEYDYSRKYTPKDEIDDLRFDLESEQIVGDFVDYETFVKDYDTPTEAHPTKDDGMMSTYYWGQLKLMFENFVVVRGWRGVNLANGNSEATPALTVVPQQ